MKIEVKNGKLSITDIDISEKAIKAAPKSKKGQNPLLASTHGFVGVPGQPDSLRISLNVMWRE